MLRQHLQCKLAEDYIMAGSLILGSGEQGGVSGVLGLAPGFTPLQTPRALAGNSLLGQGLATDHSKFAWRAGSLVTLGLLAGSVSQTARFKMRYPYPV